MRILSFNQSWLAQELRQLGHEVVTCGHVQGAQVQIPKRVIPIQEVLQGLNGFSPEILLFLDDSMPAFLVSGLDTCDIPSVFYSVDTHQHLKSHLSIAPLFDHVLVAQRDYLAEFASCGTPVSWFPLWAPRSVEPRAEKRHPAAFVGTLDATLNPRRVRFFSELSRRIPIHIASGDYAEVFPFAEIVINQTVKGDLNFRVFEAMMCGAVVLTERTGNGLLELFTDGKHLLCYTADDIDEIVERFHDLRRQPARVCELAMAGREEILARHTGRHRALDLDRLLRTLESRAARSERHFTSMVNNASVNRILAGLGYSPCVYATSSGLLAAEEAYRKDLSPSERETTLLISICGIFDQLTSGAAGADLIRRFYEKHPHNPLLTFARMYALLERGETSQACEVAARQFPISPSEACDVARDLIPRIIRGEIQLAPQ